MCYPSPHLVFSEKKVVKHSHTGSVPGMW